MMASDRLFAVEPTAHERGVRRRANLRAQGSMFDLDAPRPWCCPACGGDRDRCSCATTGAQALALELDEPAALDELEPGRDRTVIETPDATIIIDRPAEPLSHHEALAVACERCVSMFDVLTIHRGDSWKQMHTRTTTPGWAGGETFGSSDANGIEVGRGHYDSSPTIKIRWSELADVIRAGITPEQIAEALEAADEWRDLNSKPHNFSKRDDKTRAEADAFYERYSAITGRFRAVERAVIARGLEALAPTPTLL